MSYPPDHTNTEYAARVDERDAARRSNAIMRERIAELCRSEGDLLERAQRAERALEQACRSKGPTQLVHKAMHDQVIAERDDLLKRWRLDSENRDSWKSRAEVSEKALDASRAETVAILGALEEWGRWPELPGVRYGAELVDVATGETRELVLRPEQIKGLSRAIMVQVQKMRESEWGMAAVKSHNARTGLELTIHDLRRELRAVNERVMQARRAYDNGGNAAAMDRLLAADTKEG